MGGRRFARERRTNVKAAIDTASPETSSEA